MLYIVSSHDDKVQITLQSRPPSAFSFDTDYAWLQVHNPPIAVWLQFPNQPQYCLLIQPLYSLNSNSWMRVYEMLDPRYPHWDELVNGTDDDAGDYDEQLDMFLSEMPM